MTTMFDCCIPSYVVAGPAQEVASLHLIYWPQHPWRTGRYATEDTMDSGCEWSSASNPGIESVEVYLMRKATI